MSLLFTLYSLAGLVVVGILILASVELTELSGEAYSTVVYVFFGMIAGGAILGIWLLFGWL